MNKQALLEETYNSAFNDELEKISMMGPGKLTKKLTGRIANFMPRNEDKLHRAAGIIGRGIESATTKKNLLKRKDLEGDIVSAIIRHVKRHG